MVLMTSSATPDSSCPHANRIGIYFSGRSRIARLILGSTACPAESAMPLHEPSRSRSPSRRSTFAGVSPRFTRVRKDPRSITSTLSSSRHAIFRCPRSPSFSASVVRRRRISSLVHWNMHWCLTSCTSLQFSLECSKVSGSSGLGICDSSHPKDAKSRLRPSATSRRISSSSWSVKYRNGVEAANSSPMKSIGTNGAVSTIPSATLAASIPTRCSRRSPTARVAPQQRKKRMMKVIAPLRVHTVSVRLERTHKLRIVEVALGNQHEHPADRSTQALHLCRDLLHEVHRRTVDELMRCVEPQAIDVVVLQPHQRIVAEEPANL